MPLRLQADREPAGPSPEVLAFLKRVLRDPNAVKGLSDALTSLSIAPTPLGAAKGPELGAEATAGLSEEELDILGDLMGTGAKTGAKKAASKAAPKLVEPAAPPTSVGGSLGRPNPTEQWRSMAEAAEKPSSFRAIPPEGSLSVDELKERVAGIDTARGYLKQLKLLTPKADYALDTALGMLRRGEAAKADALIQATLRASLGSK